MYADAAAIKGCMNSSSFPDIFWLLEPRMSWSHKCKSPWYPALTWARVKSHKEQIFGGRNQSCSLTFNAIEWRFLFCSLPKPCAVCHTGKVGNMGLQSRSKRRRLMPMCPPDVSIATPWKKWVGSIPVWIGSSQKINRNLDCKKSHSCVLLCGWM